MQKIRLGIIGTGIAAKKLHLPALKKLEDCFEITCVCNHTEPKAKEFASMVDAPYVLDYNKLLARDDVDAVDIMLPVELNYQAVTDSLRAGKHVMVEKPIAASLQQAKAMADYDKKYPSLVTMVAENFRYAPGILKVRDIVSAGSIGDVYSVHWDDFGLMDTNVAYSHTQWRLEHKYPGGFVMDAGVHNIAALRMLLGELDIKSAKTLSINPDIGKVDSITMTFETAGGVFGCFNDYFSSNGFNENRIVLLGKKGAVILQREGAGEIVTVAGRNIENQKHEFDYSESYTGEFRDFYNAVTEGRQVRSRFEQGAKDFETMLNALKAAGINSAARTI